MLPYRSRASDLAPRGCQRVSQTPQEGMINTVKTFLVNMHDEGQADVPDEPLTVEGALLQMLL